MRTATHTDGLRRRPSRVLDSVFAGHHWPHRVDIWSPDLPARPATGTQGLVQDRTYILSQRDVVCCYNATPENNEGLLIGRTQADNLFTLDRFFFPEDAPVADLCVLAFLTDGPNRGRLFMVQGSPQRYEPGPHQPSWGLLVLAKALSTPPPGVTR